MPSSPARRKRTKSAARKKPVVRMIPRARVPAAVETLSAPTGTARFAAGKALCVTAEKDPGRVYAHFDQFAALLASDSKIVRWNAMQIVASLAAVDTARKLDAHLDAYLAFITGGNLISAANAIGGAGRIAQFRPDLREQIIPAILAVEHATYETAECRNVAIGHALKTLQDLGPSVCGRPDVVAFARRQTANTRAAVARRAALMTAST